MRIGNGPRATLGVGVVAAAAILGRVPAGVLVLGVLLGGLSALSALGLVLLYRAHRFLHIAHAATGLLAGAMVAQLVTRGGWPFFAAAPVGVLAGAGAGVAAERLLIGRLGNQPRVVLTVASAGLASVFGGLAVGLPLAFGGPPFYEVPVPGFDVHPVHFGGAHVLALAAVPMCLAALAVFLRLSPRGLAARALAQNADRARSLGVPARAVSALVWGIAGALASVAGILSIPILGLGLAAGPGTTVLLLALAPAVVAGMRGLPTTVGAAVILGIAYQVVLWITPSSAWAQAALFGVVLAGLAVRDRRERRTEEALGASSWSVYTALRPLPARAAGHVLVRAGGPALAVAATAAFAALPFMLSPSAAQRVGVVAILALAAASVGVVMTFAGQLSFGGWALAAVGSAVTVAMGGGSIGILIAMGAGAVVSMVLGLPSIRGGAFAYAASTLAFAVATEGALVALPVLRSADALTGFAVAGVRIESDAQVASLAVVVLAVALVAVRRLRRSATGRRMVAARDNEPVALAHGVPVRWVRIAACALAGAMAGLAGALYAHSQHLVHPDAFRAERSLLIAAAAVVGGLGSVAGAASGGAVLGLASLILPGAWRLLGTGAGVLVVLVVSPGGVASAAVRARDFVLAPLTGAARREVRRDVLTSAPPPAPGRGAPAPSPRHGVPAPATETRQVREIATVRRASWGVALAAAPLWAAAIEGAGALGGLARVAGPALLWIVGAGMLAFGVGVLGWTRGGRVGPSVPALVAVALAAAGSPYTLAAAGLAAAWTIGAALRLCADTAPAPLRSAALGWLSVCALGGAAPALHALVAGRWWLVAYAACGAALLVAASRAGPADARRSRDRERAHAGRDHAPAPLALTGLEVAFGPLEALRGIDLALRPGEVVALIGTNGAGKTTLLRAAGGLLRPSAGSITIDGEEITGLLPEELARRGLVFVDGARPVFPGLSVAENLRAAAAFGGRSGREARRAAAMAAEVFPVLSERRSAPAGSLSGGEQRILALAQTMLSRPRVLLVDELTLGLHAGVVADLHATLRALAAEGCAVVVVEHRIDLALDVAHRVVFLDEGVVRYDGPAAGFIERRDLVRRVRVDHAAVDALRRAK